MPLKQLTKNKFEALWLESFCLWAEDDALPMTSEHLSAALVRFWPYRAFMAPGPTCVYHKDEGDGTFFAFDGCTFYILLLQSYPGNNFIRLVKKSK